LYCQMLAPRKRVRTNAKLYPPLKRKLRELARS
jgi:hypothetical protein